MVNSVLSAIPTYWMSIFRLPSSVIKAIDRIRRDFLWSGPDIDIYVANESKVVGGISDLHNFNQALMGKWWWKLLSNHNWRGAEVVQYNYGVTSWNLFPHIRGRVSFFWKGVLSVHYWKWCVLGEIVLQLLK